MTNNNIAIFLAALFFMPNLALAVSCNTNDFSCKTAQAQMQAMENAGIKPSTIVAAPGVNIESEKSQKKEQAPKPYEIPKPMYSTTTEKPSTDQNLASQETEEKKRKAAFKMFIPTTETTTEQAPNQQEFVFQPPKSPLQPTPPKPQMTGIQYQ